MKHVVLERLLLSTFVLSVAALSGDSAQHRRSQQRHWEETETETIWRDRYTNCDYGYYVVLSSGIIAHGSHSPAPNHGFLVSLPDVGKTSEASVNDQRFLWVNAEYNMSEAHSLRGVADYQLNLTSSDKAALRIAERKSTTLGGIAAIRFRFEYGSPDSRVTEEEVVALRSGVVYEIGLRTRPGDYDRDNEWFEQIRSGLKLLSLPQGECSND
jgi:hypothetical protein